MEVRYGCNPRDFKKYNTKEIRVNGTLIWKQGAYRINRVALAYEDDSQTHIKFLVRGGNYMFQSINH